MIQEKKIEGVQFAGSKVCQPRLIEIFAFHSHGGRELIQPPPGGAISEEMNLATLFTPILSFAVSLEKLKEE